MTHPFVRLLTRICEIPTCCQLFWQSVNNGFDNFDLFTRLCFEHPLFYQQPSTIIYISIITYLTCRESWMDINSQCSQQNSVQETFQNGTRGLLHLTVQREAPTPVFLTTIFQSWLSFVTHIQAFQFQKVETYYCLKTLENYIFLLFSVKIKLSIRSHQFVT